MLSIHWTNQRLASSIPGIQTFADSWIHGWTPDFALKSFVLYLKYKHRNGSSRFMQHQSVVAEGFCEREIGHG